VRVLLDHCLPRRLKKMLPPHNAATAAEMGWDNLRNGTDWKILHRSYPPY